MKTPPLTVIEMVHDYHVTLRKFLHSSMLTKVA